MADANTATDAERFEVRVTADTHFGWLRTRLSVERTMMSWIRTAVSLIGFGFAIVQFFERMNQMPGVQPSLFPNAPKYLGLALISLRHPGTGHLDLAVPMDRALSAKRFVRSRRRTERRECNRQSWRWRSCLSCIGLFAFACRAAAPGVAAPD